jgi:hypothetical protein
MGDEKKENLLFIEPIDSLRPSRKNWVPGSVTLTQGNDRASTMILVSKQYRDMKEKLQLRTLEEVYEGSLRRDSGPAARRRSLRLLWVVLKHDA